MKVGIDMHSMNFKGKEDCQLEAKENPVMYPATYYGYPIIASYPTNSGYETYSYSPKGRDIYNIGSGGSSSSKTSKTLEEIKKKVDSINTTFKNIEEVLKKKL